MSSAGTIPPLSPSREEFRDLAGQGNLVPVFAELPADLDTPLSAYLRLRPGPYSFLLESVEGGEVWARYSFLGTDPLMVLSAKDGVSTLRRGDGRPQRLPDKDPLEALRRLLAEFKPVAVPGLPRGAGNVSVRASTTCGKAPRPCAPRSRPAVPEARRPGRRTRRRRNSRGRASMRWRGTGTMSIWRMRSGIPIARDHCSAASASRTRRASS